MRHRRARCAAAVDIRCVAATSAAALAHLAWRPALLPPPRPPAPLLFLTGTYNGLADLSVLPHYEGNMLEEVVEVAREPSPATIQPVEAHSEAGFAVSSAATGGAGATSEHSVHRSMSHELRAAAAGSRGAAADEPSASARSASRMTVAVDDAVVELVDGGADPALRSPTAARAEAERKQPAPPP